jgi:glycine cleavage system H protein
MSPRVPDPSSLTFMMGEFAAELPQDRLYVTNHMWALPLGADRYRFGLTSYAVRLLQDVYFLDWTVTAGTAVKFRQGIGSIESKKAESDLFAPAAGTIESFSDATLADPTAINLSTYDAGWLFEMRIPEAAFLEPQAYLAHLDSAWQVAQRTIKGQVG